MIRCENCQKETTTRYVDDGYGDCGDYGHHHDYRLVSVCCGADVVEVPAYVVECWLDGICHDRIPARTVEDVEPIVRHNLRDGVECRLVPQIKAG